MLKGLPRRGRPRIRGNLGNCMSRSRIRRISTRNISRKSQERAIFMKMKSDFFSNSSRKKEESP